MHQLQWPDLILKVRNKLVRISQQCLSGGFYWIQVSMVTKIHNVPYSIKSKPQSWYTSNGIFSTEKIGNLDLVFPVYSHSKHMHITLDIVEFEDKGQAPIFDLIIGTESMQRVGIALYFKTKMIIIVEIALPMRKNTKSANPKCSDHHLWSNRAHCNSTQDHAYGKKVWMVWMPNMKK